MRTELLEKLNAHFINRLGLTNDAIHSENNSINNFYELNIVLCGLCILLCRRSSLEGSIFYFCSTWGAFFRESGALV